MKIITEDGAYVQKHDLAQLQRSDMPIPATVFNKMFERGIFIVGDHNRFDFIKFVNPDDIEYFKNIDWMVDYYDVKDLSDEDIIEVATAINEERQRLAAIYNPMSDEERSKNSHLYERSELLNFKFYNLRDFVWFRRGEIDFVLPEGIEYPVGYNQGASVLDKDGNVIVTDVEVSEVKEERKEDKPKEKGFKQFIKKILGRK